MVNRAGSSGAESDREQVLRLLIQHRSSLFSFILSLVRQFPFAEEIMQEVALVVCERWADFRPGTDFPAWARQIARNKIFSLSRAAGREIVLSPEAIANIERVSEAGSPSGWAEAVRTCMEGVGGRMRDVLSLRYHGGLNGQAIAE